MWGLFSSPIWLSAVAVYFIARETGLWGGIMGFIASAAVPGLQWWLFYGSQYAHWVNDADRQHFLMTRAPVLFGTWLVFGGLALTLAVVRGQRKRWD